MTITNPAGFIASQVDWAILDGCFSPTNCNVSDIDGTVERCGAHLRLERKNGEYVELPEGQARDFRSFSRHGHMGIVFWTKPDDSRAVVRMCVYSGGEGVTFAANLDDLRTIVRAWFEDAQVGRCEDQVRLRAWQRRRR